MKATHTAEAKHERLRAIPREGEDSILVLFNRREDGTSLPVRLSGPLARRVIDHIEANETNEYDERYDDMLFIEGVYVVDSAAQLKAAGAA